MPDQSRRAICWIPLWNTASPGLGLEQLLLSDRSARSVLLAFHEDGQPFCLQYQLDWNAEGLLLAADLHVESAAGRRSLGLRSDGAGHWKDVEGRPLSRLEGCQDIDIWPTPFTNSFPVWRSRLAVGERREFRVAWVAAPELAVQPQLQAYTRLADRQYRFENLDGSGFRADLTVDADGLVVDYPGYFARVPA